MILLPYIDSMLDLIGLSTEISQIINLIKEISQLHWAASRLRLLIAIGFIVVSSLSRFYKYIYIYIGFPKMAKS